MGNMPTKFALTSRIAAIALAAVTLMNAVPASAQGSEEEDYCDYSEEIEYGDTFEAEINDDQYVVGFCFEAEEGDVITIESVATDGDLDVAMTLADPYLEEVYAENDDATRRTTDSQIEYKVEEDGVYFIAVYRVGLEDGDTSGTFEITLENEADSLRP
jgi:hypothetical protein